MKIRFGGHCIDVQQYEEGGGSLTSTLKDKEAAADGDDDAIAYNTAIDGLEALVLAQACAGIDITTPEYLKALEVAVEAIYNNTAG
jgi:hypothetical protein